MIIYYIENLFYIKYKNHILKLNYIIKSILEEIIMKIR